MDFRCNDFHFRKMITPNQLEPPNGLFFMNNFNHFASSGSLSSAYDLKLTLSERNWRPKTRRMCRGTGKQREYPILAHALEIAVCPILFFFQVIISGRCFFPSVTFSDFNWTSEKPQIAHFLQLPLFCSDVDRFRGTKANHSILIKENAFYLPLFSPAIHKFLNNDFRYIWILYIYMYCIYLL